MRELEHFVVADERQISASDEVSLIVEGRIWCEHGIFVDVRETLELNALGQVRVIRYSYHAALVGHAPRTIFRYDNAHVYVREGHEDEHHRHRYDYTTWTEVSPPEWIGRDRQPQIRDVIVELQEWWQEIGQHIADDG